MATTFRAAEEKRMPKRAKRGSSGGRAKKKAKKDDPLAELKALKALVARQKAENAAQKEALAAKDEVLAAKDETIAPKDAEVAAKDAEVVVLQESIAAAAFASPLLQGRARTANGCKAHAHGLLDVVERTSEPSKAGLTRCHTLRASLVTMRGKAVDALDAEGVKIIRDVTRAVKNSIANQVFHVDTSLRRMRHSIDLQQMPLQNMIKQVDAAETLASAALASETPVSFGRRLATSTRNFLISDPDTALPKIHNTLATMEQTMKIEVDSTVWPRVRREAMAVVERFAVGMATTHGALHPIFEIQSDSNVMRRIMALAAPTATSRRAERQQWARKLIALQPVMDQLPTVVTTVAAAPQASSSAAAAGSAAAPIALDGAAAASSSAAVAKKAKESLSLINVIAKDFLDKFTDYTAPSAKWAATANPWLAMAVMQERCVTLKGHAGKWAGLMGVYKLNEEHSTEGKDVYTNVVLSDVHLFRGTDGMMVRQYDGGHGRGEECRLDCEHHGVGLLPRPQVEVRRRHCLARRPAPHGDGDDRGGPRSIRRRDGARPGDHHDHCGRAHGGTGQQDGNVQAERGALADERGKRLHKDGRQ